jgi:hypothetical protein
LSEGAQHQLAAHQPDFLAIKGDLVGAITEDIALADRPRISAALSRVPRFNLLWRGSRDGFRATEFHRANTLTLIVDTDGNIFCGFTAVQARRQPAEFSVNTEESARRLIAEICAEGRKEVLRNLLLFLIWSIIWRRWHPCVRQLPFALTMLTAELSSAERASPQRHTGCASGVCGCAVTARLVRRITASERVGRCDC